MKQILRTIKVVFVFFGAALRVFGQDAVSLDEAITEAGRDFAARLTHNATAAVTSFGSHSSKLSDYIITEMTKHLVNKSGARIVDRLKLDEARKELNFSMSGEISDATAQRAGRFLGSQYAIFGSISEFNKDYYIEIRALQVETGHIQALYTSRVNKKSIEEIASPTKPYKQPPPSEPFIDWGKKIEYAYRNYWDFMSGYVEFGDVGGGVGGHFLLGFHWSPFPFAALGFETMFDVWHIPRGAFSLGFVFPFTETVKLFGDGLLEIGFFAAGKGLIGEVVTPAFDVGLSFFWADSLFGAGNGFDIKYRGTWYENFYTHAIGIVWTVLGGADWRAW